MKCLKFHDFQKEQVLKNFLRMVYEFYLKYFTIVTLNSLCQWCWNGVMSMGKKYTDDCL